ncbi:MAG TPA: hypothetical protein DER01_16305 [Phycisphaerales bacterium]|nr:hypothetical protein [Phycisphaerales bacterium]|tara:strand:- start:377 stop:1519 length:1143 start_codon:yes stop_codon:yes gene_type:complete
MADQSTELVVFSDDWGRHPSSCQHLVNELIHDMPALWVNTIGMRLPRITASDIKKIAGKLKQWTQPKTDSTPLPANLRVINPLMYPGFRNGLQRRVNAQLLSRQINRQLDTQTSKQRIAITTIPVVADLVGKLNVDHWVYYCVDDFSVWPGLDSSVMQAMEEQLVRQVDRVIAVSDNLVKRLEQWTPQIDLLTHGIELDHWQTQTTNPSPAWAQRHNSEMIFLFWGLIDPRLDTQWCLKLAAYGKLVLVGPVQSIDPKLAEHPNIVLPGSCAYADLPSLAQHADVLVMPYADLPVTRAMQPLKFKEYLATGKPIVARNLPGILDWQDCADLVADDETFITRVVQRSVGGLPALQQQARNRLQNETWQCKAQQLKQHLHAA